MFDEFVRGGACGHEWQHFGWQYGDAFEGVDNGDGDSLQSQFPRIVFEAVDGGEVGVSDLQEPAASFLMF